MGLLRYILQGFGWQVGAEVAKEAVEQAGQKVEEEAKDLQARVDKALADRARKKAAERAERERKEREARTELEIERELAELKRKARE